MSNETEENPVEKMMLMEGGAVAAYKAEQETQNTIARANPRDPRRALANALMELEIAPEYACKSFYVIPFKEWKNGESKIVNVEGPSIKAAITLARTWGNNASGWRIKDQSTERVEVEGVYVDHETNTRTVRTKTASRFYTKKGTTDKIMLREEALTKAIAAAGSKAVRDAILAGQPFWYTDSYYKKAREIAAKTIGGKAQAKKPTTYAEKLAWVAAQYAKKGVTADQFAAYIVTLTKEKPDQTEDERIGDIVGALNAVADGQATVEEVFGPEAKTYAKPQEGPSGEAVAFNVASAATTDFNGNPDCYVLKDTTEPPVKYFTDSEEFYKLGKAAAKEGKRVAAVYTEKEAGGKNFRWLLSLQAKSE